MRHRFWHLVLLLTLLLGSHNGYVALWTTPGGEPDHIFPYSVASLPREDQVRLKAGIEIKSKEELMALLEDYLS